MGRSTNLLQQMAIFVTVVTGGGCGMMYYLMQTTIPDIQRAVVSSMGHPVSAAPLADGCTTQDYMHTDRYHDCP
ncbi:hypothetical protein NFI96_000041 [Prochilodus magdalenae]|nr:hypothetical protein NFI96_000041 [Prochilodus magdalenae]